MKGKLTQFLIAALMAAGSLVLAGCTESTSVTSGPSAGVGPGGGTVPPPGGGTTGSTGTRVQLLVSNPQIPSAGSNTVDITAVVLDVSGQAVTGMFVAISTGTDPSAFTSQTSNNGLSDANGLVTAKLNVGSNKTNRVITLTATTADGATISTNVTVVGTTISVSGTSTLTFGSNTTLTFSLKDSAGIPIPGIQLTVSSANGNGIGPVVPPNSVTDSAGQVSATITATAACACNDVITGSGAGTSKTQTLTVSGASFNFTTPASGAQIPLNTATAIAIHWTSGGVPVAGQPINFSSTRGVITGTPANTNGAGDTAGVLISSTTAGPATITATGTGTPPPAATLSVTFVATTASSISAQAIPGTVAVTTGSPGQTNNTSTIQVVVRDAANNLVQNAGVTFTITSDPTAGQLAAPKAVTDVTGTASVTYTAGGVSSPQNGVIVTVRVTDVGGVPIAGPPVTDTATLTVSGQSLLVRLGTDNLIQSVPPLYKKTWAAIVTDAAGNAISGAQVQFALRPGHYLKGFWVVVNGKWTQSVQSPLCNNEDVNFNGILDPGEDFNGNGRLEPGGVADVNPTATTDSSGVALAVITYPKNYAFWAEVTLEARSGVTSNDPPTTATFFLEGLASDYSDTNVSPPGEFSPFGVGPNCSDTL